MVSPEKETLDKIYEFDSKNYELVSDMVESFSSLALGVPGNASGEDTILTTWLAEDDHDFNTKELLNQLGTNKVKFQSIVVYGCLFNVMDIKELDLGLSQLNSEVELIKRY